MSLAALLQWSGEHAGLVAILCLAVSGGGLLAIVVYKVALAVAVLRAWWRGGSWLERDRRPSGGAGGYSSEYQAALTSPHFRRVRAEAIRRHGGRCAQCGVRGRLEAHHALGYARLGRESAGELLPLCHDCHMAAHGR